MFRTALMTTSALVIGTATAFAAAHHQPMKQIPLPAGSFAVTQHNGRVVTAMVVGGKNQGIVHHNVGPVKDPAKMFSNLSKDANAEFLSFYGWYTENYDFSGSTYSETGYQNAALPVTGDGAAHKSISVPIYSYEGTYQAGVYASASGNPGNPIFTVSITPASTTSLCCTTLVTGTGHKTVVPAGNAWVEVTAVASAGCNCESYGLWLMENTNFTVHGGGMKYEYGDHFHTSGGYTTNYNSGWLTSSGVPAGGAVEVK